MSDSVNFNAWVFLSSLFDYKEFIEGRDTGETKIYKTSDEYID